MKFKRYSSGRFQNKGYPVGAGISGKGEKKRFWMIPDSLFKRELEEYKRSLRKGRG